jgi:hypothetical protein
MNAMSAKNDKDFRPLQERERKILERLLKHHPFEGRDQLRRQLDSTTARLIVEHNDNYGSIELRVADPTPASVLYLVPVRLSISTTMGSRYGCCSMSLEKA